MYIFGYLLTYCHLKTIAKIISAIGNPLTIALFFGVYITLNNNEGTKGGFSPLFYIFFLVIILAIYILINLRRKKFNNFDVSNQKQRNKVFILLIILISALNIQFYYSDIPLKAFLVSFFFLIKIILSFIINQKFKVSMHTSMNYLFALVFYPINPLICDVLFIFGFFIAWSRLVLKRHTVLEVILGFILGSSVGFLYLLVFNYYI